MPWRQHQAVAAGTPSRPTQFPENRRQRRGGRRSWGASTRTAGQVLSNPNGTANDVVMVYNFPQTDDQFYKDVQLGDRAPFPPQPDGVTYTYPAPPAGNISPLASVGNGNAAPTGFDFIPSGPDAGKILLDNVYGWFARTERGIYALTPAGHEALARWPQPDDAFTVATPPRDDSAT